MSYKIHANHQNFDLIQNKVFSQGFNLEPIIPVSIPDFEPLSYEWDSATGNATFNIEVTGGEYWVGKTLKLTHVLTDPDGIDTSTIKVDWYSVSGNSYDPNSPVHTGSSYTLSSNDLGNSIGYRVKFDDLGSPSTTEQFVNFHSSAVIGSATFTPNTERSVFSYNDFSTHLGDIGLTSQEVNIKTLADTLQGKWGGDFGTHPNTLSYAIMPKGKIEYTSVQQNEHPLYKDIHDNSTETGNLAALAFTDEEKLDIQEALNDWTSITGINFNDATSSLGSKADIVFTKLDFEAWYNQVYSGDSTSARIDPGTAGFAFGPTFSKDFIIGDVFLSSDLVARNLDPRVYDLTSSHVTTPGKYILRGNNTNGYDAYLVNETTENVLGQDRTVYTMSNASQASETGVFSTQSEIFAANLTIVGYLNGGMSVKGVASHEIGHALGLAHPHDGYFEYGNGKSPWSDDLANYNSVMSYEGEYYYQADTPMMYDYYMMKALYGGASSATGDNNYTYDIDEFWLQGGQSGFNIREMLHDPDGNDSITLISQVKQSDSPGVYFNLSKGSASNFENTDSITDAATKLEEANFILSEFTQIENLTTTDGNDIVGAEIDWAATVSLGAGDDTITTNGYGAVIQGGSGDDRLIVKTQDLSMLYATASDNDDGAIRYKSDDSLFCEATDVEFIRIIEGINTAKDYNSWQALAQELVAPSNNNNNNNSGSVTTESLVLPFDTVVYSIDATESGTSVSTSGLYVLKGSDTDGYDAYAVTGNSQVGYTVSKTADVADLYANAAAISAAATATDATKIDAVGELQVRIVEITTGQDNNSQNMNGLYAIKENGSAYDAYEVSVDGNGNYSVASTVAKTAVYADATALGDATDKVVGYLDVDAAPASYFAGTDDKSIFEIEAVDGERYGNIITYGVKLVDGHAGENVTLTSLQFDLSWDTGEYSYWGQFTPENASPSSLTYSAVDTSVFTPTTFFSEVGSTGVAFGMFDDAGMNFDQGEYVATFMLEKTSNTTSTDFDLTKAQYTLYDAYDSSNQQPEEQASTEKAFSFNPHTVTLKLETENDQSVSDVELLTTNLTTNDGLSIVPVLKNGDIIQYQLVMNVPIPTFIQNADDSSVNINPNHKIDITGAKIFDKSITWLTDLAEGETSSLISDVNFAKSAKLDDGAAISAPSASVSNYTGHEFLDLALSTSNGRADLQTSDKLTFEFEGLTIPQLMAGTVPKDAEGRYILAEFSAVALSSNSAIAFQSSQKSDENGAAWQAATVRNISREEETTGSPTAMDTGWVKTDAVSDGSEVVLLAEGWYMNERASNDAVGAEDALGALRVSRDGSNGNYSQAEIIASDFNLDGRVTAADAYDILQYSVAGPGSVDGAAKWVYIDNIDSNGATADNVHYDEVTDTFIGKDTTIDATAVLIGDVTSSYSGLTSDPTVGKYADWLEALASINGVEFSATQTANTYTGALTTGEDFIEITDTGRYDLTGTMEGRDDVRFKLDATSMGKINTAVDAETKASISEASPDLVAKIDAIFGADDGNGDTVNLAELSLTDTDTTTTTHIVAYDLDGSGTFEAANDLMITYSGTDVPAATFLTSLLVTTSPYEFVA